MTWTDENRAEFEEQYNKASGLASSMDMDGHAAGLSAVATHAVELAAARGGTMTEDAVHQDLNVLHSAATSTAHCKAARERLNEHLATQGATVATLQAKVAELERVANDAAAHWKSLADGWQTETIKVGQERDALRAEVAELVDERDAARQHKLIAEDELGALRAEVERLKAEASTVRAALKGEVDDRRAAESRHESSQLRAEVERLKGELRAVDKERNDAAFQLEAMGVAKGNGWIASDIHTVRKALEESPVWKIPGVSGMTEAAALRLFEFAKRTETAEAHLAAIRERARVLRERQDKARDCRHPTPRNILIEPCQDCGGEVTRSELFAFLNDVLEGDAPQEGKA